VDTFVEIPNHKLTSLDQSLRVSEGFKEVDKVLRDGVASMVNLIVVPGEINADYADILTVMKGRGRALFGTGMLLTLLC
jgi:cell division protein FtsZ